MICYCGKPVWEYDAATWTCKSGHHTPKADVTVERFASPEPPPPARFTFAPWMVAALSGAVSSIVLFVLEHLF